MFKVKGSRFGGKGLGFGLLLSRLYRNYYTTTIAIIFFDTTTLAVNAYKYSRCIDPLRTVAILRVKLRA